MTFSKLGTDTDTRQFVYLPKSARVRGLYIIGLQGMGKSGLLENLIMQDIYQQIGVCVLDPKGDLVDNVIARLDPKHEKDVILLDIANEDYPFGLNLFECPNLNSRRAVEKTVDRVVHIFDKLLGVSDETPLISQYLLHCTHTLVANPGYTMAEIPLLLTNKNCRQKLVANVKKSQTRLFWDEYYDPMPPPDQRRERISILRRVEKFLQDITLPIVGQSTSTIDLQKIMDGRKILLVKLDRTMEQVTTLIGSMIVALILNASASRQTHNQFHLYADEFQRFATEDFATLLEEARYAGIGVTMAHQNRAQLELSDKQADANLKARTLNVGSLVVFYVPTDADELAGQFDTTPPLPAPEEKTRRAIQTPVMEPIQFMLHKGVHPHPEVRNFINVYGQELVQGVKQEEEAERNFVHAMNTYYRDVGRGYGSATREPSPPTQYYHLTLESLNQLFYQAMVVGKQGGNTDTIPIASEFIGYFINALTTVPQEVKQFPRLQQLYIDYVLQQQIQVGDWNTREWRVRNRLTQLALPQSAPRQSELQLAQARYTKAVENLRSVVRRAFVAQVEVVRERCVIIQKGNWYYRPAVKSLSDAQVVYELDYVYERGGMENFIDFQKLFLGDLGMAGRFRSLDEAIAYHVQALSFLWFHVEPTLRDKNWWQHKRSVVRFWDDPMKKGDRLKTFELDTWVPKPGIERTWYTSTMLDNMVENTLQAVINTWAGGRPGNTANLTLFLPDSLGGRDYRELSFWSSESQEQDMAWQEGYDAHHELTNLQGEIAGEVHQETASLQGELGALTELLKLKPLYDKFVADLTNQLRMVMRVLATPEGRIEAESGQQEIVMGHGIQLSSAEMEARISKILLANPFKRVYKRVKHLVG